MEIPHGPPTTFGAPKGWRGTLHHIIFGWETPAGRAFDLALIVAIILSVVAVMFESIEPIRLSYRNELLAVEWLFTVLFTLEYVARVISVKRPVAYMGSFFGVIDVLAILPTYLSVIIPGAQYLLVIRILRILRVFRVLKLVRYLAGAQVLASALTASMHKIAVFMAAVLTLVTILGSFIYMIEGAENGFTSIPRGVYWAIVTVTTVGYGDISPQTPLGQLLASAAMLLGYAILAVPTGIVSAELSRMRTDGPHVCTHCGLGAHDQDAIYCKQCSAPLDT